MMDLVDLLESGVIESERLDIDPDDYDLSVGPDSQRESDPWGVDYDDLSDLDA